jgi:hypothetical protein
MTGWLVSGLLVFAGVLFAVRGMRRLLRGLRHGRSLELARGLRSCVTALAFGIFATGLLTGLNGVLVLGVVFLAEELYETGLLIAIVRSGEKAAGTPPAA